MRPLLRDPLKGLAILLPVLIVAAAPSIRHRMAAERAAVHQGTVEDLEARNQNAFALILGEIRATAADLMFIKTEDYIHDGIRYRPHINKNLLALTGAVTAETGSAHRHDPGGHAEHGQCPGGVPTLIRTAANDFRGFIGGLERETKPFRDPKLAHPHGNTEELLPWYRLMTLTDPRNLRGYMIGTMLLMFARQPDEALAFIQEGIEKNRGNPLAFRLYASLTQVHRKSRHFENASAADCLEKALAAARQGYEMGKAVRPEYGKTGAVRDGVAWTEDIENDFMFVARVYPLLLDSKGEVERALHVAREVASLAPDDGITKEMIERFRKELSSRQAVLNQ